MTGFSNVDLGADLGEVVDYVPAPYPRSLILEGVHITLTPLLRDHAASLHQSFSVREGASVWRYLPYGPFASVGSYGDWISENTVSGDPYFFAVIDKASGAAVGVASYLRISPKDGSIEVGHINFAPRLQKSIGATEAMFLMMRWAFESGYRRYEWKCNALNMGSRRAAQRLGFSYEGVFRQCTVSKGRNRDTAWFGVIDKEWPLLRGAFEVWLGDDNFDAGGRQKHRLSVLTAPARVASDPLI